MAVPLVYNSCLSDEALEALVADTISVNTHKEEQEQEKEKEAWENDQNQKKEAAFAAEEEFKTEEKEWPEILLQPLLTK